MNSEAPNLSGFSPVYPTTPQHSLLSQTTHLVSSTGLSWRAGRVCDHKTWAVPYGRPLDFPHLSYTFHYTASTTDTSSQDPPYPDLTILKSWKTMLYTGAVKAEPPAAPEKSSMFTTDQQLYLYCGKHIALRSLWQNMTCCQLSCALVTSCR